MNNLTAFQKYTVLPPSISYTSPVFNTILYVLCGTIFSKICLYLAKYIRKIHLCEASEGEQ